MNAHGGSTRHDDVAVEVLADIEVALHDRVVGRLVNTGSLESEEGRLEESLGGAEAEKRRRVSSTRPARRQRDEPLVSDGDDLSIGELVRLLESRGLGGGLHLLLKVERDVTELLLDVANDLALGGGGEGVSTLHEDLDEVVLEAREGVSGLLEAQETETRRTVRSRPARSRRRMA